MPDSIGVTVNCNTNCNKCMPRRCRICQNAESSSDDIYSKEDIDKIVSRAVKKALTSSDDYSEQEEATSQEPHPLKNRQCSIL